MIFCPPLDPPGKPKPPTVSEIFKDSCIVTWEPPSHDGGSPITGYHLERRVTSSNRWIFVTRDAISDTTFKVTDLIEGNEYEFRVAAENKVGTGPPSEPSEPFTARDPWGKSFSTNNIPNMFRLS